MSTGGCRGSCGGPGSRSLSPSERQVVPRLSLLEMTVPQASPRVPMSPRAHGTTSPNAHSPRQRGSPRFGTPRDSARDSARDSTRLESARRRSEDSYKAHVMRRRNCSSSGQRSSVGSCVKGSRRPNPLLSGNAKTTTPSKHRSSRVASPGEDGGTGGASCRGSVVSATAASPYSTPVRGSSARGTKNRRGSSPSPASVNELVWQMASNLPRGGSNSTLAEAEPWNGAGASSGCEVVAHPVYVAASPVVEAIVIPPASVVCWGPSADPRSSVDPSTENSSVSPPDSPSSAGAPIHEVAPFREECPIEMRAVFAHKKTPSFRSMCESGTDNDQRNDCVLRSARTVNSPMPDGDSLMKPDVGADNTDGEIDENREHVDIQEDNESFAGSTCGEVQALCDKAQYLVSQMSAFVTPPVPPPSGAVRAFVVGPGPGPGRPPRPPQAAVSIVPGANYSLVASPVGSAFGSVGPSEIEDDEMNQLKFRVSHIELGLKRRGVGAQDSPSCSEEVAILRRQLEETQMQLLGAVDEIQDAKSQIHKLAARLNLIPLAGGSSSLSVGGSFHAPHRQSTPNHLLKPHLIAAPTPTVLAISATTPRDSPAPTARLAPTPRDSPAPAARIQRRPSSPKCMAQTALGPAPSRPASPLLATHICRRTSTDGTSSPHPAPTACQLSLAASNAGMASTASFNPPLLVRVGSQNGSQRVSPLRTQGHVQSAQLFEGTPPPTARLCAQQMQFGNVLTDRGQIMRENPNLAAQAAQKLQFHSTMPTARGNPIRVGGVPTHVLRSPRV